MNLAVTAQPCIHFDQIHFCEVTDTDVEIQSGVIDIFLESGAGILEQLLKAATSRDAASIAAAAHKCRGGIGLFGAFAIVQVLEKVELAASAGDLTTLTNDVAQLKPWMDELLSEVMRYRGSI